MANESLADLITSDRLYTLSSRDSITQIKAAAIRQFEALDGRLKIHSTEYFNHSFAPDLVLSWRASRVADRYVYMRSSSDRSALAEDVLRLGAQKPIVLGLAPVQADPMVEVGKAQTLNTLARESDTLVTDAAALASVAGARKDRPIAGLFSTALAQAGRGLVDSGDADATTETIAAGFAAAADMGSESVLRALTAVDEHLAAPFASRFNRILQAVWIGSGGRADLFPQGHIDLTAGVDDEALEFLLDLDPVNDMDFWRRIGRTTTVHQISQLSPRQPNDNLQYLVKANLDHLTARACRIQDQQIRLDETEMPEFWWRIEHRALTLRSYGWTAFIAEKAEDLGGIEGTVTGGVSISDLIERARSTVLVSLQMSDGVFEMDLSSAGRADVARSGHFRAVSSSFGSAATVQRASALVDQKQILCDFMKSSASTVTSSVVLVGELLNISLPLLRAMSEPSRQALQGLLEPQPEPDQLDLGLDLSAGSGVQLALPETPRAQTDPEAG